MSTIEAPKWAKWNYDLEEYFVSQMKYPAHLLRKNQAGYSVAMFSLDTLGLPRRINILTSIHKDFDKEVIRLIRDLPHCLPCRDKNGKRIECLYTVYVPFLPQRYRDRIITDSIAEEELKHCFVEWEEQASLQDGNPHAVQNYIYSKLRHNSDLLYKRQKQVRGVYSISIDSYGEVTGTKTLQSCGIQEWDSQVEKIIKGMPRWTPTINHYGKGEYQRSLYTVSVWLKNRNSHTMMRILP
ncbi:MAG: energy transducer TonB [Bacteroides thetaiotaomicron]